MLYVLYILTGIALISLYRLIAGPTFQDRLLSLSLVSVILVLMLCVLAVHSDQSFYLDIAMVYALLSFGEIVAFVKIHYWRKHR